VIEVGFPPFREEPARRTGFGMRILRPRRIPRPAAKEERMKKVLALSVAAVLCLSLVALAGGDKYKEAKQGTISKVDIGGKTLMVKDTQGNETALYWDDSTKVEGGELKEGETIHFKAKEKDGKLHANWIHVGEMKKM
jgi:hypothetical protein